MLKSAVFGQNHVGDKFVIGCGNHFGKDQRKIASYTVWLWHPSNTFDHQQYIYQVFGKKYISFNFMKSELISEK